MSITLSHSTGIVKGEIYLTASKSESNRALIIRSLSSNDFKIENLAAAKDTNILNSLLNTFSKNDKCTLSTGHAGTVMRFMTAFLALQKSEFTLTGSDRMKERPIKVLVDTLKKLGADINYIENEGYPPLLIKGKELVGGQVEVDGSVSSQYISALLLIAPKLEKGLQIQFKGDVISQPYINMTIEIMKYFGANLVWKDNSIIVEHGDYKARDFTVEADWSAASYWYSIAALAKEVDITLYGLKKESLQGDAVVQDVYKNFGVQTEFIKGGVHLTKPSGFITNNLPLNLDFEDCPDIAQTVAVTCAALNVEAHFTGLKTLRIKETDRVFAIENELNHLGYNVGIEGNDIVISKSIETKAKTHPVKTYDDHRMAMAFAPLGLIDPITIKDEEVVVKSYPNFWKDLKSLKFEVVQ